MNKENRIHVLDDMRGIAILTVLIYHYLFVYYKDLDYELLPFFLKIVRLSNDFLNLGTYGVSIFFLISGFVIHLSLGKDNIVKNIALYTSLGFFLIALVIIPEYGVRGAIMVLVGARATIALMQIGYYIKYKDIGTSA